MKIDPSSTSANLDYGESQGEESEDQEKNSRNRGVEYHPVLSGKSEAQEESKKLRERRAMKKKKERKKRKLAERKAKHKKNGQDSDDVS